MFEIVIGDIVDATEDYICHQVNCRNAMGYGVARQLYIKYPEVKSEYHKFCAQKSPYDLLGQIQVIPTQNQRASIINIFGQLNYGRDGIRYTDYRALEDALIKINQLCAGKSVAFPHRIGCGLAGGNWATVEKLIVKNLPDCNVRIYMKD